MKMEYLCNLIEKPVSGEWGDDGDKIAVIRSTNFTMDGILDLTDVKFRDIDNSKIAKKKLQRGDIIIEKSGGSLDQPVGRVVFFDEEGDFLFSNFTSALRPKQEKVFPKYLNYLLLSAYKGNITSYFQNRTTGIINLQLTRYVDELQIPLPPLPTQQKIAAVLDKADAIRKRSQQILAKYDQLAQSVFLEMFGKSDFNIILGKDLIKIQGGAAFKSTDFQDIGIPVIRIGTVNKGYFDESQIVYLPESFLTSHSKYVLKSGDLLLTLTGTVGKEDYGNLFILDHKHPSYLLNQRVAKLELNKEKLSVQYLKYFLEQAHIKQKLIGVSRGVRQANISNGDIYNLQINLPPMALQNHFTSIITQIEKQKAQTQQELNRAEELYQSLLQRAFTGELFPEPKQKELTVAP
jgi:type I restriction enzyme S subunit